MNYVSHSPLYGSNTDAGCVYISYDVHLIISNRVSRQWTFVKLRFNSPLLPHSSFKDL
jgi:hypothetical protein